MKYNNDMIGKIIFVNSFIFDNGQLDHAWNTGRPCLVIDADEEYEYVLPITHEIKEQFYHEFYYINELDYEDIYLNRIIESALNYRTKKGFKHATTVSGYVNLLKKYPIQIAYRDEVGKLNKNTFESIIVKYKNYHHMIDGEEIKSGLRRR